MKWLLISVAILAGIAYIHAECGRPQIQARPRVIAGKDAIRGSWPWQILLYFDELKNCGGTLIAPDWVVTAAHCVYRREIIPDHFTVRVGEHDFDTREGTEVDHQVMKIYRHPAYNPRTIDNDIAVLKLKRPVTFNKYVQPACLPSGVIPVGSYCYITGWGKVYHIGGMNHILQQARLQVPSNKVCDAYNWKGIGLHVRPSMICGGDGGKTRKSGCQGDSGGPFVCNVNGIWELHGSVSHGSATCSSSQAYSVFSRTSYLLGFIKEVTGL